MDFVYFLTNRQSIIKLELLYFLIVVIVFYIISMKP